jgi:hypothetical protein
MRIIPESRNSTLQFKIWGGDIIYTFQQAQQQKAASRTTSILKVLVNALGSRFIKAILRFVDINQLVQLFPTTSMRLPLAFFRFHEN